MFVPTILVVGLGPGDASLLTPAARDALRHAPVARLRTRRHPAAEEFADVPSYDEWYETASSFDELYSNIVMDLIQLAADSPNHTVVYAVPGSPIVAERTVELLFACTDIEVRCQPAVSVIDVACAALGRDPMGESLRVVDALSSTEPLRGPGPLLVLQTYSAEILATVADRLPPTSDVIVLHHLGLPDEHIASMVARSLPSFTEADHLTSLWVPSLRTAGEAMDDLVDLMRTLRVECPWDEEQTHSSLTRHLLEEAYEALDALEAYDADDPDADACDVIEELGDVLFQIVFHAELGSEDERFDLVTIADGVREKLVSRHPHVFGDVEVNGADDVATRWEENKRVEKKRSSVTDGIALQLPALTLYAKMRRKALSVGLPLDDADTARGRATRALDSIVVPQDVVSDAVVSDADPAWGDVLSAIEDMARIAGIDLEGVLRARALQLRDEIRASEGHGPVVDTP